MTVRFGQSRIFVVDDHPANVALMRAVLSRAGFEQVFTETDSRRVLPRLPEVDPDLIILDLHMPHLDGFEVLAQIRAFAPSVYLPVLVLTADTTAGTSQRALGAGAQDFVTKPFNNEELMLRAGNLLETRSLYTTLRGSILRQTAERTSAGVRRTREIASTNEVVDRLRMLDGLKDTLLQTVSHDLRNPISAVLALTSLLAADAAGTQPLPAETKTAIISKVESSARKMDRLLTDLLDSDPMRAVSNELVPCDVGELVGRVLAEADLGRDHPVHTDLAPVTVPVDPIHVERIVENLLSNARQHVAPGVDIWVSTAAVDGGVLIVVEDAGAGVDTGLADAIFQPFRRGRGAGTGGLGLGLSLVQRFAELHGGRAWVEPRSGGGSSFRVYLPAAADPGTATEDGRPGSPEGDADPAPASPFPLRNLPHAK